MTPAPSYTKLSLFEFVVLYHPDEEEREQPENRRTRQIVDVTSVLARDEDGAAMLAARAIPDDYTERLDRCEVVVRPF